MSAEGAGHVYRWSPYKGAVFAVHAAIGDSINDQNDNLFWMSQPKLARKARVSERAAREAIATLEADGWLVRLQEQAGEKGRGTTFQFVFREPGTPVFDSRTPAACSGVKKRAPRQNRTSTPATGAVDPGRIAQPHLLPTQENPKGTQLPAASPPRRTDDPISKRAHELTTLAMEQPVKPVLRGNSRNPFPAVMEIIERLLRAGISVQAIKRAIEYGIEVWTVAGIQTAIAHANPKARQRASRDGDSRSLMELVAEGLK